MAAESPPPDDLDEDTSATNNDQGPVFILYLDEPDLSRELDLLKKWVADLLTPTYLHEPTPDHPWCPQWWDHDEAVALLHGIWLAWQKLTDPQSCDFTDPDRWHFDNLYPALDRLRAAGGPLQRCMTDRNKPTHRPAQHVRWTDELPHQPQHMSVPLTSQPITHRT
ncbi:DUF4913 domain-containing protein [Nonomuraea sp. KM90]|uniref:DUF4913 domain-containing protein n=1 Tax=Nonomuraea sp. KM90 TaxID=3457428 RepID=UPI003FCD67CE